MMACCAKIMGEAMKYLLVAALACLSLALISEPSFAAKKAKMAAKACTEGALCHGSCDSLGWCQPMRCVGGKWVARPFKCWGPTCISAKC
jgi:hypothetical protein